MSLVLSNNLLGFVPIAIVTASLFGSPHCIGMCGGLIVSACRTKTETICYHLARLASYFFLGSLAGFLGEHAFHSPIFSILPWVTSGLLALGFIVSGIQIWKGRSPHFFQLPIPFYTSFQRVLGRGPISTGLLTGFLPCGWLHTFILGALATGNPWFGGLYLALFWLGTLPALILTPLTFNSFLRPLFRGSPQISAFLLVSLGLFSLLIRIVPMHSHHSHQNTHFDYTHSPSKFAKTHSAVREK